jgi:hypothetical protein
MVDISILKEQGDKAKKENLDNLCALLEQKSYIDIEIDGYTFKIRRLGIAELKLIEKIKDDTNEDEIRDTLRVILSKMLLIDEDIIREMDDGILVYIFTQIVSKVTKEIVGDVENFQKQ